MYSKTTLKNGLTILKVPIPSAKSVLVDVFVKVGSRQERPQVNGISHFLEHLFFKGSKKFPTAQDLSHALDAIGAEYNANTGKEHTQFYIKAAKKHLPFIFEVLTDMLQSPVFDPAEIEREKGVIIEEINMYEDTPMRHVEDILEETMWPRHPLGRNIAGTKAVVRKITPADIHNYVSIYYQPQNIILAVTGSFPDAVVDKFINRYWARLTRKRSPAWRRVRGRQRSLRAAALAKKTEQYHLALGFLSYSHNHPDNIAQTVLATILGGGMSSRLFTEIRERRGWAYYVRASAANYQDTGNFVIQAGVRREVLLNVLKTVSLELAKIKSIPVGKRELDKAKEYLKGTLTLSLEASESLLGWFLEQTAFRKKILIPEEAFRLVDRVTAGDIRRVARDIFQMKRASFALIGPKKQDSRLKKLLRF
ncbi:MAG: insulinase family protein [Candidatus Doudnabacteria bacterium]|nr:insulinase family protein [Candidatus Doudnabacteria bacterium]